MKAQDKQQISTLSRQIFQDFGVSFKAGTKASMARLAALAICQKARKNDAFVQQIGQHLLATLKTHNVISHTDAAFSMRLSRGVVATYGTLDEFINANLQRPGDIKSNVRDTLRISSYEMLFLKKEPYVVVFEGVELVRAVAPKATGLANAVLRKMIASADAFLDDHEQDKILRLARRNAFPVWLVERVISDLGADNASLFCEQANEDAPLFVAANTMLISENELFDVLFQEGAHPQRVAHIPGCIYINNSSMFAHKRIQELLKRDAMLVSDASAQRIAQFMFEGSQSTPDESSVLLEVGSGRGTKTLLLQNAVRAYNDVRMTSYAIDNLAFKADILKKRLNHSKISWVYPKAADATKPFCDMVSQEFSHVFIDAPCSGVGTLRRHPEIRWRVSEDAISENAKRGLAILQNSASYCKKGGTLVYSTCTIFREENEEVIQQFLNTELGASFELEDVFKTPIARKGPDIHFAARLRRIF